MAQPCPICKRRMRVYTQKVKLKHKQVWIDYCQKCKTALSMEDYDDSKTKQD